MIVGEHGYVGLAPLERDLISIASAVDPDWLKTQSSPNAALIGLLQGAGEEIPDGFRNAVFRGTRPLSQKTQQLYLTRLLVLGDAAGYVEPFTGEGMVWALLSARYSSPIVEEICRSGWQTDTGTQWEKSLRDGNRSAGLDLPDVVSRTSKTLAAAAHDVVLSVVSICHNAACQHHEFSTNTKGCRLMTAFRIAGTGTAVPRHFIEQPEAALFAGTCLAGEVETKRAASVVEALYRRSGVRTRHSVVLDSSSNGKPATQSFYGPSTIN